MALRPFPKCFLCLPFEQMISQTCPSPTFLVSSNQISCCSLTAPFKGTHRLASPRMNESANTKQH